LKENIIMGRLIPAGTGLTSYKRWKVVVKEDDDMMYTGALPGMSEETATTT
jgi:DNA-directed RNA polymerase subunit beta'